MGTGILTKADSPSLGFALNINGMGIGILTKADSPSSGFGYLTVGNSGSGTIYSKKLKILS